ncbi:PIG-P-domain-containing protein [Exophiala viscosa]|uniref:PIG-P-domain-containing protein n=1 Tax=Exophiala viscosa TaxID=2486360 RepID=UPI00218FD81E|nr:PIG-P-domain-containing protein [Exophiala viscosa]
MPPQSRGPSPESGRRPFPKSEALPPTLRPYLDTLPSPTTLIPDQRTPTGPRFSIPDRDNATPTPTPRKGRDRAATAFELGAESKDVSDDEDEHEEQDNDEGEDVAGVTLDDDDFERHYSRQESPESEEEVSEEEGGYQDEDGDESEAQSHQIGTAAAGGFFPSSSSRPDALSRVRSLPARPPMQTSIHNLQQSGGLHTSQSTTSLPPVPPPLYPPFYNRPPTPLPPSPSLTSLLRPPSLLNRSATSTRATTPDSSDVETPNDTEAAVAHSARRAHPLPPTSPKVPTYEYYGFVLYLASTIAFLIYILWSYLPSPFLHALGITYYPNRWWSLAIPAWIVMLLVFIYVALLSYNVEYLTLPMTSLECMVDEAGNVAILDESGRLRKGGSKRFVREMEERARMERAMEKTKSKNLKSRKQSKSGSGSKDKGKQRRTSSRRNTGEFRALSSDVQPCANGTARPSSNQGQAPYEYAPTFPYLSNATVNVQNHLQHSGPVYPNWQLVWNEGTDAVMDVPIGGVCEVLYG